MIQSQHLDLEAALCWLQSEPRGFNLGDGQCSEECPVSKQNKRSACTPSSNNLVTLAKKNTHMNAVNVYKNQKNPPSPVNLIRTDGRSDAGRSHLYCCHLVNFKLTHLRVGQSRSKGVSFTGVRAASISAHTWTPAAPSHEWPETLTPLHHRSISILLLSNH